MPRTAFSFAASLAAGISFSTLALAQCLVPNPLTSSTLADASKVMANFDALATCLGYAAPAGAPYGIQFNAGSGSFGAIAPMVNGQLVIGSTGNPPRAAQIQAGAGIAIANSPGGITISATGSGTGSSVDWLNQSAVVKPVAANFTLRTSTQVPAGAALAATSRGMLLSTTATADSRNLMADMPLPTGHWQATMLGVYSGPMSSWATISIGLRDTAAARAIFFGVGAQSDTSTRFEYFKSAGGVGLDNYAGESAQTDLGFPYPTEPVWSRLTYDGTNLVWAFSQDGENYSTAFTVSATDWLTNLSTIGPSASYGAPTNPTWGSNFHILSWNLTAI